ncbi:MAG: acetyl-CoA hydrolase/transferase C-terminal domain-containing protein, partial [archaeon]
DYIVTEHGVAHLKGKSIRDRVNEMIKIAHPDFKEQLRKKANKIQLW